MNDLLTEKLVTTKELGYKSAIEFNKILHKDEIIFKQNGRNFLLNKYSDDYKLIEL